MKPFVWSDQFVTGIETVDREHRGLVTLINTIGRRGEGAQAPGATELVFEQLFQYATTHFVNEEWLMQQVGCDTSFFAVHCAQHARFLKQVESLQQRGLARDGYPALMRFLSTWLMHHILGTDQSMARQIQAIRGGATPKAALEAERSRGAVDDLELEGARERLMLATADLERYAPEL